MRVIPKNNGKIKYYLRCLTITWTDYSGIMVTIMWSRVTCGRSHWASRRLAPPRHVLNDALVSPGWLPLIVFGFWFMLKYFNL